MVFRLRATGQLGGWWLDLLLFAFQDQFFDILFFLGLSVVLDEGRET